MEHILFVSQNSGNAVLPAQPYRLFLDDVRMPYEVGNYMLPVDLRKEYRLFEWVIVRNYNDFTACIKKHGLPTHISFDHDLGEDEAERLRIDGLSKRKARQHKKTVKSGMDCTKWLCDYLLKNELSLPVCYIHSMNPVGKENIEALLGCFQRACSSTGNRITKAK